MSSEAHEVVNDRDNSRGQRHRSMQQIMKLYNEMLE